MLSRISAIVFIAVCATATVLPRGGGGQSCSTGPIQCCNQVQNSSDPAIASLAGLLGIVLPNLNIPVGLACSPLNVLGIGGTNCAGQTVCCDHTEFNGLINLGCNPININL